MGWDTDVFGGGPSPAYDKDIFKESAPASAVEGPVGPPDNRNWLARMVGISPADYEKNIAAMEAQRANGWGTGFPKVMDQFGARVGEATGSPAFGSALGTTLGFLPDAVQMLIGGEIAKGAAPVFDYTGKSLMSSALKPPLGAALKGKGDAAVKTLLDEGINVSAGGAAKAKGIISDLADEVSQKIANSGATIDTHKVADYASQAYGKFSKGPLATQAIDDIGRTQAALLSHPEIAGARDIPVQLAQEMKSGYYKALTDKVYGELKTPLTEAEKGIARGFKTEIGQAVPGVLDPLARESSLINAMKLLERRVAVEANKNPLGVGALITQPWMIPVWMWDRSALAKSIAGRLLYSGQEVAPALAGQAAMGGILASQKQE